MAYFAADFLGFIGAGAEKAAVSIKSAQLHYYRLTLDSPAKTEVALGFEFLRKNWPKVEPFEGDFEGSAFYLSIIYTGGGKSGGKMLKLAPLMAEITLKLRTMATYQPTANSEAKQEINILSFDGGGSKGVMEVFILKDVFNFLTILQRDPAQLEFLFDSKTSLDTGDGRKKLRGVLDHCKNPIHPTEVFDFIVGTSVGSIIAFGLVGGKKSENKRKMVPMEVDEIIFMFKEYTEKMFEEKDFESVGFWLKDKIVTPFLPFPLIPYSQDGLEKCLIEHFGDIYLGGFPKPRGCVAGAVARHFFNSGISGKMVLFTTKNKNYNYKVVDVLKASSAAPIYFQTPVKVGEDDYIDGGDGGNCPLAQALPAVEEIFGEDVKVSTVLSIAPPRTCPGPIPAEEQWIYWLGYFPTRVTDGSSVYDSVSKDSPKGISFQRLFPKSDKAREFKLDEKDVDAMISCMAKESTNDKSYFTDIIQAALTITLRLDKPGDNKGSQICEKLFSLSENEELTLLWLQVAEHEVAPSNEIAQIRRKLGDCYYKRGSYGKAIRCYQKSMEESDQQPEDMAILNNRIGACFKAKNCYQEAITFFKKNLELTTSPLVVAESYNHVGDCNYNLGKVDLAIAFHTKALDHIEAQKNMRPDFEKEASNFIANSYNGLGNCYLKLNEFEKALQFYSKSLGVLHAVDGMSVDKKHKSKALGNMGLCYLMTGRFSDAIRIFESSLDLEKEIHGHHADHPAIAISYTNLGKGYLAIGDYDGAINSFTQSRDMNIKIFGEDSAILDMAETFNNLGICFLRKPGHLTDEILDNVVTYFRKSLHIQKTVYGKRRQQQSIGKTYNNLGRVLMEKHNYDGAIKKLNKSLDIKRQIFGSDPENKSIAITYINLGDCHQKKGNIFMARKYFDKVNFQVKERLEEHFY